MGGGKPRTQTSSQPGVVKCDGGLGMVLERGNKEGFRQSRWWVGGVGDVDRHVIPSVPMGHSSSPTSFFNKSTVARAREISKVNWLVLQGHDKVLGLTPRWP